MALQFTDCKITIHNEKSLTVEYVENGATNREKLDISLDPYAALTVERLHAWINFGLKLQQERKQDSNAFDPIDLQVIGLNLYRILFGNEQVEEVFQRVYDRFLKTYQDQLARNNMDLRMRLLLVFEPDADRLGKLPWEFLFMPDKTNAMERGFFFAGKRTELILTRFVPPLGKFPPAKTEQLRILVAVYTPTGMGGISTDDLNSVLAKMKGIANAEVREVQNLSYDRLRSEIAGFCPHIFHFIGHGTDGKLSLVKVYDEADYDESLGENQIRWISSEEFKDLFSNDPSPKPLLVFLHACRGASATLEGTFISCARWLVNDIPAVVAMQHSISNQEAGTFAAKFYEQLGAGCEIDEAVRAGRVALGELYPRWRHPRFATPVVYLQKNDPLVRPVTIEKPLDGQQDVTVTSALRGGRPSGLRPTTAAPATASPAAAAPAAVAQSTTETYDRPENGADRQ
jgi:hypothetical protein